MWFPLRSDLDGVGHSGYDRIRVSLLHLLLNLLATVTAATAIISWFHQRSERALHAAIVAARRSAASAASVRASAAAAAISSASVSAAVSGHFLLTTPVSSALQMVRPVSGFFSFDFFKTSK